MEKERINIKQVPSDLVRYVWHGQTREGLEMVLCLMSQGYYLEVWAKMSQEFHNLAVSTYEEFWELIKDGNKR